MKILIIGGSGTIGKRLHEHLQQSHDVIIAGKHSGQVKVNLEDSDSIIAMFKQAAKLDAVICVAGEAKWGKFEDMKEDDFYLGIKSKLMGQVNLVRLSRNYVSDGGSITLSSGVLADEPVSMTSSAAMVNGALNSFVKAVDIELNNIRVNVVCSDLVEDSYEKYKDYFPGYTPVPMKMVIDAYVKCIEGKVRGEIIRVKA